jgi:DTW domain-containing protein YfiP
VRQVCYRCFKPALTCVCATIPAVRNRTHVTIIQHPRERNHPIGTARFAVLGLQSARLIVHGPRAGPCTKLAIPGHGAALLYPHRDGSAVAPADPPTHLVVLDGTWHHAKTLLRADPGLQSLPRYALGHAVSQYRIRREPARHCLSTIEAILIALAALEPQTEGLEELRGAFMQMIDRQQAFAARPVPRHKSPGQH